MSAKLDFYREIRIDGKAYYVTFWRVCGKEVIAVYKHKIRKQKRGIHITRTSSNKITSKFGGRVLLAGCQLDNANLHHALLKETFSAVETCVCTYEELPLSTFCDTKLLTLALSVIFSANRHYYYSIIILIIISSYTIFSSVGHRFSLL
jgi:hypothetical protein